MDDGVSTKSEEKSGVQGWYSVAVEVCACTMLVEEEGDPMFSRSIVVIRISDDGSRPRPHPRDSVGWINSRMPGIDVVQCL